MEFSHSREPSWFRIAYQFKCFVSKFIHAMRCNCTVWAQILVWYMVNCIITCSCPRSMLLLPWVTLLFPSVTSQKFIYEFQNMKYFISQFSVSCELHPLHLDPFHLRLCNILLSKVFLKISRIMRNTNAL